MKKFLSFACIAALAFACSGPKAEDPALSAVKARVGEIVGEGAKVTVSAFERIDSTTFGDEIAHRIKVQELAIEQNGKYVEKYKNAGNKAKSAEKKALIEKNKAMLEGLKAIETRMADSLEVIAYYDYRFSGEAVKDGAKTVFREYYASVTPDGRVLSIENQQKGLHKSLGRVIPGYQALLDK